jgi:hypothetical protein
MASAKSIQYNYLTMNTTLFQQLPQIYQSLLPDIFNRPIAVETYADCSNCNMCQPNSIVDDQRFFSSKTKCCTFKPIVPNYLIGGIINDPIIISKITDLIANKSPKMMPLGYFPSQKELSDYAGILPDNFGIDDRVRCELLNDGDCSIWKYRNSMCSTYFCHYFKGKFGKLFWEDVRDFLQHIESALSEFCCHELGVSNDYLKNHTTNFFINVQSAVNNERDQITTPPFSDWGKWADKESDFYTECTRLVHDLKENDIRSLAPTSYDIKKQALEESYDAMVSENIPSKLKLNPECKIIDFDSEFCFFYIKRLIKLPRVMKHIAPIFNGEYAVSDLLKVIPGQFKIDMDMAFIRHLYEQDILVEP